MFFSDWLPMLYNALWTSWPCMFTYIFDKDVEKDMAMNNPIFFEAGHRREYFNFKKFWVYVSKALFHGLLCYYMPMLGFDLIDSSGKSIDTWWHSSLSFTLVLHVVTYKLFVDVRQWNLLTGLTTGASIIVFYISVIILNSPSFSESMQPQIMGVFSTLLNNQKVWLLIIGGPFFILLPDISIKIYNNWWARTPVDWQIKQIDDDKLVKAQIQRDIDEKKRKIREEILRKKRERKKLLGDDYIEDEDEENNKDFDISNMSEKKLLDHTTP